MPHGRPIHLLASIACALVALEARGQIRVVKEVSITGTVESVGGGRVVVRDEAGGRHEVLVQRTGERGVTLDTGDLVAKALVIENQGTVAVRDRGDAALENTYRSLSAEPPKEPRLVRSRHFAFLSDVSDREWAVIRDKLERMVANLERYFGRKGTGVVEGFIVRDLAAWPEGVLQEAAGVEKIRRGEGVCFNATLGPQRRATLYSCDSHGVIHHGCVHGFCHLTFGSTGPTWLAEGVAELGNYWRDGDTSVEIDPGVMGYIRAATPKRRLPEIAVPGREPAGTWQNYAWRWALCHLLATNPNYADRFRPLAIALMEEKPGRSPSRSRCHERPVSPQFAPLATPPRPSARRVCAACAASIPRGQSPRNLISRGISAERNQHDGRACRDDGGAAQGDMPWGCVRTERRW